MINKAELFVTEWRNICQFAPLSMQKLAGRIQQDTKALGKVQKEDIVDD